MSVYIGPIGQTGGVGFSAPQQNLCQVSITHPTPAITLSVVGTGDKDLDPAVYPSNFVTLLDGYEQQLNKGTVFETLPDGRVKILVSVYVTVTAYADIQHSANNTTAGAAFSIERGAVTALSARSVHAKLPNTGDIGNISGVGSFVAEAGDIVGIALASNVTGNFNIRASSLVFEAFF